MKRISRKEFINRVVAISGTSLLSSSWLQAGIEKIPKGIGPIGFQSWIVRDLIGKDFPGT